MAANQAPLVSFSFLTAAYIMLETWFFAKLKASIAEVVRLAENMLIKSLVPVIRVRLNATKLLDFELSIVLGNPCLEIRLTSVALELNLYYHVLCSPPF
jgi:hypothetical protein